MFSRSIRKITNIFFWILKAAKTCFRRLPKDEIWICRFCFKDDPGYSERKGGKRMRERRKKKALREFMDPWSRHFRFLYFQISNLAISTTATFPFDWKKN